MKKIALLLLTTIALFSLAACGSEELTLELSETFIELELGESETIDVTTNLEIETSFLSLNTGVATVSSEGVVSSVGVGSTNIRVTVGEIVENVTVKVVPVPVVEPEPEVILTADAVRDDLNDVTVAYATSLDDAIDALPLSTIVYDDAGNTYVVDLTWAIPGYDGSANPLVETDFIATGSFSLPEGLEPGDISFEVSMTVSVLPVASEVALNLLNTDPNSATLSTFIEAGVNDVSETNLNAIKAALVVAKNVTLNPGWAPSDIQAVVDNVNLNGGMFSLKLTMELDGSLDYLELSSPSRYLKFESEMISEPLVAFLELNNDLLDGQMASFDFTLGLDGNTLNRMNLLELASREELYTNFIMIPSGALFNGLTIDGLNQELYVDFIIGANDVTLRNVRQSSLVSVENASEINVVNAELRKIANTVDTTLNITNVKLLNEINNSPFMGLSYNYGASYDMTFLESIGETPISILNILLVEDPENLIGSEYGYIFSYFMIDFFGGGFYGSDELIGSLLSLETFETTEDVMAYLSQFVDLAENISNSAVLEDIYDNEFDDNYDIYDVLESIVFTPTVESLTQLESLLETTIRAIVGKDGLERYIELINVLPNLTNSIAMIAPREINSLPTLTVNGVLEVDDYIDLIGMVDGLNVVSNEEDSEFYIYQGSFVRNFSFDENITLETGNIGPGPDYYPYFLLEDLFGYDNSNIVALENGSFYNGIYEVNSNLVLLLLGDIDGNGAEIAGNNGYTMDVIIGLSPNNPNYTTSYDSFYQWESLYENISHQGNANVSNIDFSDSNVTVVVVGEDNEITNSTMSALIIEQVTDENVLTLKDSVFIDGAILYLNYGHLTLETVVLDGSMTLNTNSDTFVSMADIANNDTSVTLDDDLVVKEGETLTVDVSGTIVNLDNLKLFASGDLLDGQDVSVNLNGTGVLAKWQVATASGVYVDLITDSSVTLSSNEDGKTLRLVLVNMNDNEEVVAEVLGLVALDVLAVENSTVSLESETSVQAGTNNISLELALKTANDLDVMTAADVNFVVSSAGILLADEVMNLSDSDVLSFTITEAGLYEDVFVYVSESGVLTAFDQTFDFTVVAATPDAITVVSPVNLTQVGAGASYDIDLLVEDTYGNPVPNALVSLSAVGLLDDGSGFASETMTTDSNGTLTATLTIDPVALPMNSITLAFDIENDSESITGIELFESVSEDSSATVITGSVVAGNTVELVVTLVDTKDIPQVITGTSLTMLLVNGTLESGTVVATASSVNYTSTTGNAVFTINAADDYDLNLYVETFEGSNEFVLVQDDLEIEVSPATPASLNGPFDDESTIDVAADSTTEMTVTLEDTYGNVITDEIVTFELRNGLANSYVNTSNTTSGTLTINSNGEYVFDIVIAENERLDVPLQIALSVSGLSITYTIGLEVNNTLDANASSADDSIEDADIVAADDNVQMIVTLVNVSGDAIDSDDLGVYLELADNTTLAGVLSGSGITREAVFTITDTSINSEDMTLYVESYVGSGEYLELESNIDLDIVAGNAHDVVNLTYSAIDGVALPGDTFTVSLVLVDMFGNPVVSEDVTLELLRRLADETEIAGSTNGTERTLSTNTNGLVEWTITIGENEPMSNYLEVQLTINGNLYQTEGPLYIPIGAYLD